MTSVQVIVDDRIGDDSIVNFEGSWPWDIGGTEHEFNGTTRYTRTEGASSTFHFDGSSVQLFGTQSDGRGTLNFLYAVDGGTPKSVQRTEDSLLHYHESFFQIDVPDGQHTLTTTLNGEGVMLCIDYYLYTTTLERIMELQKLVTVLVDDASTAIIYSGLWVATSTRKTALGHTEHITNSAGSNATFYFYGTYFGVFGTSSDAASGLYTVDDGTPTRFGKPGQNSKLFDQNLDDGPHTLVITSQNDAELSLDCIVYTPSLSEAVYGRPFPSPPSAATTALTPSQTPSESEKTANISSSHAGAIAGGVLGGISGLLAIALVILFLFRRKRRSAPDSESATTNMVYNPFMTQDFDPQSLYPQRKAANPMNGISSGIASGKIRQANDIPVRAQDGGVRVLANADEESLHPPAYHSNYPTSRVDV